MDGEAYVLLGGTAGALTGTPGGPGRAIVAIVVCGSDARYRCGGDAAPRNLSYGAEKHCSELAVCETAALFDLCTYMSSSLSVRRAGMEVRVL